MTTLKVGIASYQEMKARTMAVARGERRIAATEPKVWFTSTESFAKVLSAGNRELLAQLNEGLFTLKQTGVLERLYEKWLGVLGSDNGSTARFWRNVIIAVVLLSMLAVAAWRLASVTARWTASFTEAG